MMKHFFQASKCLQIKKSVFLLTCLLITITVAMSDPTNAQLTSTKKVEEKILISYEKSTKNSVDN